MSADAPARTLLSVAEVAHRLGVHEKTVRRKIRSGQLPALQLGRPGTLLRVDRDELEAWLRADPRGEA